MTKMTTMAKLVLMVVAMATLLALFTEPVHGGALPVEKSKLKALHVPKEKFQWKKFFIIPNTYYDKPRNRYPYYDAKGVAKQTLYGYGGQTLYKYDNFHPLEGYFR